MKHKCKESEGALFTIENRGDGWYLYNEDLRGDNPINFCPCCGKKVEDFKEVNNDTNE
ncbi:hypothetical protein ES703_76033 [subsurface metagenome]